MHIAASVSLAKGLTAKLFYGGLIGGAAFLVGKKMYESNPDSRLARHITRFGEELSSDPELSIDLFSNESSSNNIDYETSKRNFLSAHKSFTHEDNSYERRYQDYDDNQNRFRRNNDSYMAKYNYDIDNYTNGYD